MTRPLFSIALLTATVIFIACEPGPLLNKKVGFADRQWSHADTLDFEVVVKDTAVLYDLFIDMEHSPEFPSQNLYIRIYTRFPDGNRLGKLVSLELADKSGAWFGRCNNDRCRLTIPIQEKAYFNMPGSYVFTLEQYTRMDPLPGVKSLGMRIQPSS